MMNIDPAADLRAGLRLYGWLGAGMVAPTRGLR